MDVRGLPIGIMVPGIGPGMQPARQFRQNPLLAIVGNPPRKKPSSSAPHKWYRTPVGVGFSVNSDVEGVAVQTSDGVSWWPWGRVTQISQAQAISEGGPIYMTNPNTTRDVHPLAFEARERYHEDLSAGHTVAAEYWRGQAGAYFAGNPRGQKIGGSFTLTDHGPAHGWRYWIRWTQKGEAWNLVLSSDKQTWMILRSEREVARGRVHGLELVAEQGRVYAKAKKAFERLRGVVANPRRSGSLKRGGKKAAGKVTVKKVSKRELAKYVGYDEANKFFEKFHEHAPESASLILIEDGKPETRVEPVHAALHYTIETNYQVPWKSNKKGSLWKHLHEGKGVLEVYDPRTQTTRKILNAPGSRAYVSDWWRERGSKQEGRQH